MAGSCVIKRNQKGGIDRVSTRNETRSILFDKIARIPAIQNIEDAASLYKSVYTDKFKNKFGAWEKRIPKNSDAVKKIKNQISLFNKETQRRILSRASSMDNPILVSTSDISYDIPGRVSYSIDAVSEDSAYLIDYPSAFNVSIEEGVLNGKDVSVYLSEVINSDTPSVLFVSHNGKETILVDEARTPVINANKLPEVSDRSPFTYSNGEPRLYFRSEDGAIHNSYADALRSGAQEITAGYISGSHSESMDADVDVVMSDNVITLKNSEAFIPSVSVKVSMSQNSPDGIINRLILKGLISGEKVYHNGSYYFAGEGPTKSARLFNSAGAYIQLANSLGSRRVNMDEYGNIEIFPEEKDNIKLSSPDGKKASMSFSDFSSALLRGEYASLRSKYSNLAPAFMSWVFRNGKNLDSKAPSIIENAKRENEKIKSSIINLLSTLGVRIVGMDDYVANYKLKNGIEPTARAWADIANSVIAVTENATEADLLEEAAHFMVETFTNQHRIDESLSEVDKTDTWDRYASTYYEIYGKEYEGAELDRMVRREILGKLIAERFQRRINEDTPENRTIWGIINDYFARVKNFLTNQRSELDSLLLDLSSSEMINDPSAFDASLLDNAPYIYFSAESVKVQDKIKSVRDKLERNLRNLISMQSSLTPGARNSLDALKRNMEATEGDLAKVRSIQSLNIVVSDASGQISFLREMMDGYLNGKSSGLDVGMMQSAKSINDNIMPVLVSLRGFIKNNVYEIGESDKRYLIDSIDKSIVEAASLKSDMESVVQSEESGFVQKLKDKYLKGQNVTNEMEQELEDEFKREMTDISQWSRWLGSLSHSSNPMVRWLGKIVATCNQKTRENAVTLLNNFYKKINPDKLRIDDCKRLLQRPGSMYLDSAIDYQKFEDERNGAQIEALVSVYPDLKAEYEKDKDAFIKKALSTGILVKDGSRSFTFKPSDNPRTIDMSTEKESAFRDRMASWSETHEVRRFTDNYYKMMSEVDEAVEKEIGRKVSDDTRLFLRRLSLDRSLILNKKDKDGNYVFRRADGSIDWYKLKTSGKIYEQYLSINKRKQQAKSPYGTDGVMKKKGTIEYDRMEEIVAYDKAMSEKMKEYAPENKAIRDEFWSELERIQKEEGSAAAYRFLAAGGHIGFTREFWDSQFGDRKESDTIYTKPMKLALEADPGSASELNYLHDKIIETKKQVSAILKQNRVYDMPGEINFDGLSAEEIYTIKELTETIRSLHNQMRIKFASLDIEVGSDVTGIENETNETWRSLSGEYANNFASLVDFASSHMVAKDARYMKALNRKLKNLALSPSGFGQNESAMIMEALGFERSSMISPEALALLKTDKGRETVVRFYMERHLLPYFKRFSPKGYSRFMSDIESGNVDVYSFMKDMTEKGKFEYEGFDTSTVDVSISSDWMEDGRFQERFLNPEYKDMSDYGRSQPRPDLYRNQVYIDKYGITYDENGREVATRNTDDHNHIMQFVDMKRKALRMMGKDNGSENLYKIPQVSRQGIERIMDSSKDPMSTIKGSLADVFRNRTDEMMYGEGVDGNARLAGSGDQMVVPRYFLRTLDNPGDVSMDFIRSYTLLAYHAAEYEQKNAVMEDVLRLEQQLLNSKFQGGKEADRTNSYRQFKEALGAYFYGIKLNNSSMEFDIAGHTIDMSKFLMRFNNFLSMLNLGFSPFVAATSGITGRINSLVESRVGQYTNPDSWKRGVMLAHKNVAGYASEIGSFDRKSPLYVLGEYMGIYNIQSRAQAAGYNRSYRAATAALNPYAMMEAANAPVAPQCMYAIMDDTRLYGGMFVRFSEFKRMSGLSGDALKNEWAKLEDATLLDMVDMSDGTVRIKPKYGATEEAVKDRLRVAMGEIRNLRQIVEGMLSEEDRVAASRNVIANLIMPHRGWFFMWMQKHFAKEHINLNMMEKESGTVRTLAKLLYNMALLTREDGIGNTMQSYKSVKEAMSDSERRNLRRSMVNLISFTAMAALSNLLLGWRDDDDNKDDVVVQFLAYLGLRSANETLGQMTPFLEMNALDMLQSPIVNARRVSDMMTFSNYSLQEVENGVYKGESKLWRQLMKMSFGKQWYTIKSAENINQASRYYMLNNKFSMFYLLPEGLKEEFRESSVFDTGNY